MYTEDSSPPITPLDEERADPPATVLEDQLQPPPTLETSSPWFAWLEALKAVVMWIVSVLLLVFVPAVVALPYLVYLFVTGGVSSAQAIATDKMLLFYSILGVLPAHLLTLAVIWMIVSDGSKQPFWKTIKFEWPERYSPTITTLVSILIALALFGLAWLVTLIFGEKKTDIDLLIESSLYTRITTAFIAAATAPLIEEVIYRGVLYGAIEKAAGAAVAIPVVSLLFAGVHVPQYRNNIAVILVITILSVVLTLSRALSGKMLPAFIIHLVFNGIQSVIIVLGGFVSSDAIK